MNKDVIISILGKQEYLEHDDNSEFMTTGKLIFEGGKFKITYEESEMTGFEKGTTTTLEVDGSVITMMRMGGGTNTQMIFENGKRHLGHYETPYLSYTVGTSANNIMAMLDETGGVIEIDYTLDIDNVVQSRNGIVLNIREV